MKFFIDENVSRRIAERLEQEGHTVIYGQDVAHGVPDTAVLAFAQAQGAVVVTEDNDFGELVVRQHLPSAGVILLRLSGMARAQQPAYVAQMIETRASTMLGNFTVLTRSSVRTRSLS